MKKSLLNLSILFVVATLFANCKNNSSADLFATGEFASDSVSYNYSEKVMLQLSEPYEHQDSTEILVHLEIDYPKHNGKNLVAEKNIRKWISESLAFYNEYKKVYEGDSNDANAFVNFYGNSYKEYFNKQNDFPASALSYEVAIKKVFENAHCVTYTFMMDMYLGGAHGGRTYYGTTFNKSDGTALSNLLYNKDVTDDGLNKAVKDGLMSYWDIKSEDTLYDYVWENKVNQYQADLPRVSPCLVKEGVLFCYQEYEVAPYAAGAPVFTIPYSQIDKYLNPFAKKLLE